MIVLYPLLTSTAVSENIVPGISKTLEQYIIVHLHNEVVTSPDVKRNFDFKIKGGKFFMKESENLTEAEDDLFKSGSKKPAQSATKSRDDQAEKEREEREERRKRAEHVMKQKKAAADRAKKLDDIRRAKRKDQEEKEEEENKIKRARADVTVRDSKSLSIEPTFITVEAEDVYGNKRQEFLGIKVVPYRVISREKLSHLILYDAQMNSLMASVVSFGRKIVRHLYNFSDKWLKWVTGSKTPTGDPRKDILMGRSGYKGEGFILLSKNEDIDEMFLNNTKKINRLFKMGWGNMIIADDVNRVAYFCMKKFKGVCTAVPYTIIYQNFGLAKVYADLEDAKRQSSSIFKVRKSLSKVLSEWITEHRLLKYISEDNKND